MQMHILTRHDDTDGKCEIDTHCRYFPRAAGFVDCPTLTSSLSAFVLQFVQHPHTLDFPLSGSSEMPKFLNASIEHITSDPCVNFTGLLHWSWSFAPIYTYEFAGQ